MTDGDWLSLLMFLSFILLIFSGYPVSWVLGGLAVTLEPTWVDLSGQLEPICASLSQLGASLGQLRASLKWI